MPELPDVEAFKRSIDSKALRKPIRDVRVLKKRVLKNASPKSLRDALRADRLVSTRRHGKYLCVRSRRGTCMVWHFGMTGRPEFYKNGSAAPQQTCVDVEFENGSHLAYASQRLLGNIRVVDDFDAFVKERKLGPDALDISLNQWREAAEGRAGAVKSLLMNQEVVAGVGNEYADEILFQTGIHPATPANKLDAGALKDIHRVMRRVLKTAVRHNADKAAFPARYLLRHRKVDNTCPKCGGPIKQTRVSGRNSYYCPKCQKRK